MATKAESVHTEEQRHGPTPRAKKRAKAKKTRSEKLGAEHTSARTARKASYAKEAPSSTGRPSRKSSRKSANRAKPDTNLTLREHRKTRSPKARASKAIARRARVRGAGK